MKLRVEAKTPQQNWTLISAEGEFMGVQRGKSLGKLNETMHLPSNKTAIARTLTLVGSQQEIPASYLNPSSDVTRCVCRKRLLENGEAYLEVLGTVNEEILLQTKK